VTLLIDPPNAPGHGRLWSHLASDQSYDELHRFARALGIPERGFDSDHYDIPAERYDAVVAAGARPVSSRDLIGRLTEAGLRRRKTGTRAPRRPGGALLRPERLRPGARVAVVAPAGPVRPERLDRGIDVLTSWGFDVVVGRHARGRDGDLGYLAAGDAERAADLLAAWCDPAVDAVICARGGYGVQRMVDLLDWDAIAAAGPKVLVGFSDITALHQAFAARLGWATVHGPVVTSLGEAEPASRDHLHDLLLEPERAMLLGRAARALVPGAARGVLVGGNLTLVAAAVGTQDQPSATGAIVVLEEVGEELYRVDRTVTQLLRAGWFEGVRAVVLGELAGPAEESSVHALMRDRLAGLGVPVVGGAPVGHGVRNLAFPYGVPAELTDDGTLRLLLPALA
jgi:muramoyltetrapeptide carboxypeptidase